ncbi:MAG TPA: PEP-CTERM sorting domain-containing protein [Pedomonas sp.]|uniref:PEP-CTERM sorting domain-containing protein n=1 Tax=Pedomonas sp. TaxID=2976421 RepID=UPI002F41402C
MKSIVKTATASILAMTAFAGAAQAAPLTFPEPNNGVVSLQYGDFTVYSLAMLNYYAHNKTSAPSGDDQFYLPSGPGRISDYMVIATGANISNSEFANTDNPFNTSLQGNQSSFWTGSAAEPSPTFTGDQSGTWDVSIDTLRNYLNGQNLHFGFNLNESNGGQSLTGTAQDALAWGKVTLVDLDTGLGDMTFIFDGTNANPVVQSQTLFDNPADSVAWGHIHGRICVKSTSTTSTPELLHLDACTSADVGGVTINQNLGADRTAFALTNADLNSLVQSSGYDIMRVELRLADMNNGYEQLFIFGSGTYQVPETPVSEPAAIGLLGLGALGIAAARRRKKAA